MENGEPSTEGVFDSTRRLGEAFLSTVRNRVELLALDLQEEKYWLLSALIWTALVIFLFMVTVMLSLAAIVFLTPDRFKPHVLVGLCLVFAIGLACGALGFRRHLRAKAPPLSDTVAELKKDIAWLRSRD